MTTVRSWPRAADVAIALVALVLLAPLMLCVAIAIRLTLGPRVLFHQARPGLRGRIFTIHKFRTMRDAIDELGAPLADAARMTALGRVLRRTSVDETPELFNVLRGEMSLVGPRPLLVEYLPLYTERQRRRHDVRPGITGLAQVEGRNAMSWEQRLELDVWYVEHRSLRLDLWILARTIAAVVTARDVTQAGHATVEKYRGAHALRGASHQS